MPSTAPAYLRQPTIAGDTVVFVADDDLWRVGAGGGVAHRLSAGLSEPATPCLSPDGQWLAYTGRDEQHAEVWLMPAAGGPARRLTWLASELAVRGWTADGHILFCGNHGQPFFRHWHAFTVAPEGGLPERLELGQVNHLAFGPAGARVIGRNTADPARWKRYRGGTAGHLWVDADGSGQFRRLESLPGNLTCPMWIGGRIWFLGDGEGVGNLYSCRPDGGELRRHTDHADFYARHAQTDGERIIYQCGAELWLFDPADDSSHRIEVEVPSARTQTARRFVTPAEQLQGFELHPSGHSLAVEARGRLFTMALWEGAVRQPGDSDGVRQRLGQWLADGRTLVCVSDAGGEDGIERIDDNGTVKRLAWDVGRVCALRAAPQGERVAICTHRNELLVGGLDTGLLTPVVQSEFGRVEDPVWSPCGRWLAYSLWTSIRHRSIELFDTLARRRVPVTASAFNDYAPSFDPDGRYLYFLSVRTFDPVYDNVQFEMSFPRAARPYLVALRAGGTPPFEPAPRGLKEGDDKAAKPKAEAGAAPPATVVDLEGLSQRIAAFPVPESRFGQIAGAAGDKVLWTVLPIAGAHGRGGHKGDAGRLEVFDFATGRTTVLAEKCERFTLAVDRTTLVLRDAGKLRALAADRKGDGDDDEAAHDTTPSRKTGWIDLARIRLAVDPPAEWRQMLREVWRLQRDHFWVADMSGVDWAAVWARYEPLLPKVATRGELSDLIWELQGELGTSHAYEWGGDHRQPPAVAQGQLACELRDAGNGRGFEITRIVAGDPWEAGADSPLHAVGVEARAGERIVAVGGQPVGAGRPPQALLVNQAGNKVELTLASGDGEHEKRRTVVVTALSDEVPARYREWVERNRAWVHEQSGGKVGYFHLPDMMSAGFAEFHRYFATECDRDALIVDVRHNRGGHVSELLLEKVARRRIAYATSRWGRPQPYPEASVAGPVVALTNEHAGSDGDIFSHGFKLMGLGTLVGKRTWGGVIGIWPRHPLADGTTVTQPEYSFWFKDVGWQVENHGTEPQVEIDNAPQDGAAGRDRQLEVALATSLEAIERHGVSRPDFGPRPNLAPPPLLPRR